MYCKMLEDKAFIKKCNEVLSMLIQCEDQLPCWGSGLGLSQGHYVLHCPLKTVPSTTFYLPLKWKFFPCISLCRPVALSRALIFQCLKAIIYPSIHCRVREVLFVLKYGVSLPPQTYAMIFCNRWGSGNRRSVNCSYFYRRVFCEAGRVFRPDC